MWFKNSKIVIKWDTAFAILVKLKEKKIEEMIKSLQILMIYFYCQLLFENDPQVGNWDRKYRNLIIKGIVYVSISSSFLAVFPLNDGILNNTKILTTTHNSQMLDLNLCICQKLPNIYYT